MNHIGRSSRPIPQDYRPPMDNIDIEKTKLCRRCGAEFKTRLEVLMSSEKRDPRVDPRPGDVFRKRRSTVTIDHATGEALRFTFDGNIRDMPPLTSWYDDWVEPWRKWAKDAEVVDAAVQSSENPPRSDSGTQGQPGGSGVAAE